MFSPMPAMASLMCSAGTASHNDVVNTQVVRHTGIAYMHCCTQQPCSAAGTIKRLAAAGVLSPQQQLAQRAQQGSVKPSAMRCNAQTEAVWEKAETEAAWG